MSGYLGVEERNFGESLFKKKLRVYTTTLLSVVR